MLQIFQFFKDDPTVRTVAKVVMVGAGCIAGAAVAYKTVNYVMKRQSQTALGSQPEPQSSDTLPEVTADPITVALQLKEEGNKKYKLKQYDEAKTCYTHAIQKCPTSDEKNLSIFYQNRAAAYDSLGDWAAVVEDCNEAIVRDSKYQKAYTRRARAQLKLEHFDLACLDAGCGYYLLDKKTKPATEIFELAIEASSKHQADSLIRTRDLVPIGEECIRSYFSNFYNDPVIRNLERFSVAAEGTPRSSFQEACAALTERRYNEAVPLLSVELSLDEPSAHRKEALLLRATLYLLHGSASRAETDLDQLLAITDISPRMKSTALLRRGLICIAEMNGQAGMESLELAAQADPTNADVYQHRGQIALLMQQLGECEAETKRAFEVQDEANKNPHILLQQYMCDLQLAQARQSGSEMEDVIRKLEKLCTEYPDEAECWCLYAQALIFFSQFSDAEEVYQRAVVSCPGSARLSIQRAAMVLAWKKDTDAAFEYLKAASVTDPHCETVYENLGLLYLNQNKLEESMEHFHLQLKYSRTAVDCRNALNLIQSIKAQLFMRDTFGMAVPNLFNVVAGGMNMP